MPTFVDDLGFEPIPADSDIGFQPDTGNDLGFEPILQSAPLPSVAAQSVADAANPTTAQPPPSSTLRRAADIFPAVAKSVVSVPEAVVGLLNIPTLGGAGKLAEKAGIDFAETQRILSKSYSPELQQAQREVQETPGILGKLGATLTRPSTIGATVVESIGPMLAGGAVAKGLQAIRPGLSALRAAAIGEGAVSGGMTAEQVRRQTDSGILTPLQSAIAAGSGAATGLLGVLGARLAKRLGVADVDVLISGGATADSAKHVLERVVKSAITEGAFEELGQSIQEQVAQNIALGKPPTEGVEDAAVQGLLAGLVTGGLVGLVPAKAKKGGPDAVSERDSTEVSLEESPAAGAQVGAKVRDQAAPPKPNAKQLANATAFIDTALKQGWLDEESHARLGRFIADADAPAIAGAITSMRYQIGRSMAAHRTPPAQTLGAPDAPPPTVRESLTVPKDQTLATSQTAEERQRQEAEVARIEAEFKAELDRLTQAEAEIDRRIADQKKSQEEDAAKRQRDYDLMVLRGELQDAINDVRRRILDSQRVEARPAPAAPPSPPSETRDEQAARVRKEVTDQERVKTQEAISKLPPPNETSPTSQQQGLPPSQTPVAPAPAATPGVPAEDQVRGDVAAEAPAAPAFDPFEFLTHVADGGAAITFPIARPTTTEEQAALVVQLVKGVGDTSTGRALTENFAFVNDNETGLIHLMDVRRNGKGVAVIRSPDSKRKTGIDLYRFLKDPRYTILSDVQFSEPRKNYDGTFTQEQFDRIVAASFNVRSGGKEGPLHGFIRRGGKVMSTSGLAAVEGVGEDAELIGVTDPTFERAGDVGPVAANEPTEGGSETDIRTSDKTSEPSVDSQDLDSSGFVEDIEVDIRPTKKSGLPDSTVQKLFRFIVANPEADPTEAVMAIRSALEKNRGAWDLGTLGRQIKAAAYANAQKFDEFLKVFDPIAYEENVRSGRPDIQQSAQDGVSRSAPAGAGVLEGDGQGTGATQSQPSAGEVSGGAQELPGIQPETPTTTRHSKTDPGFYSRINRTVEQSPQGRATGAQWKALIRNSIGFPQAEWDYRMLASPNQLEDGTVYTKAEVLDFLKANEVVVKDVTLGESSTKPPDWSMIEEGQQTHFSAWQLPGAKLGSYREVLLTVPVGSPVGFDVLDSTGDVIQTFPTRERAQEFASQSSFWTVGKARYPDIWRDGHSQYDSVANPIVRLRFNERQTSDGKRLFFLEEVQAPQKGEFEKMPELFQKNWRKIAFKWALRHASENGFDSVGWTTGEQQSERYDLSKHLSKLWLGKNSEGGLGFKAWAKDGSVASEDYNLTPDELEAQIGKGHRATAEALESGSSTELTGEGLKVGGEGIVKLYDVDFRNVVNNLPAVKKAGQKVGTAQVNLGDTPFEIQRLDDLGRWERVRGALSEQAAKDESSRLERMYAPVKYKVVSVGGESVHSISITPEIRSAVMSGQAQFARGSLVANPITEEAATQAVNERLGTTVTPGNIRFVNDPSPESDKGGVRYVEGQLPQITINLAKHDSPESVTDTLVHELLHPVQDDPAMADAVRSVADMVQEVDLSRKQALGYSAEETPIEATNELIRKFYVEHANSNIFRRAITQVVIAAKRLFGIDLTARQAAIILVQDAVKNHVARAGGSGQSLALGEGVETEVFDAPFMVRGRSTANVFDRQESIEYAKTIFDEAQIPVSLSAVENPDDGTMNRVWITYPHADLDEQGRRLLQLLERELKNQPDGLLLGNLLASIRMNFAAGNLSSMQEQTRDALFQMAQSEVSQAAILLGSQSMFRRTMEYIGRNADVILSRMRSDLWNGDAWTSFFNDVSRRFRGVLSPGEVNDMVNSTPDAQRVLDRLVAESTRQGRRPSVIPSISELMNQILETPVFGRDDMINQLVNRIIAQLNLDPSLHAWARAAFTAALGPKLAKAQQRALEEARKALGVNPKLRKALEKQAKRKVRNLWEKVERFVNAAGGMNASDFLKLLAPELTPSVAQVEKLRELTEREQRLRTLSPDQIASASGDPIKLQRLQSDQNAKTLTERLALRRRIMTLWSAMTKPLSKAPWTWFGKNWSNNSGAMFEFIQANTLIGFAGIKLAIQLTGQIPLQTATRMLGNAWSRSADSSAAATGSQSESFSSALWDEFLNLQYPLQAFIPGIAKGSRVPLAARKTFQEFQRRGEIRDVEMTSSGIRIFDRARERSMQLAAEGKKARAIVNDLFAMLDVGYRILGSLDALQGAPLELQELASFVDDQAKEAGWNRATRELHKKTIIRGLFSKFTEARDFVVGDASERGLKLTEQQISERAWDVARARAHQTLQELNLPINEFKQRVSNLRQTTSWSLAPNRGIGGLVAKGFSVAKEGVTKIPLLAPLAPTFMFGNSIGTAIARMVHHTPFYFIESLGKGDVSPWFETDKDVRQRQTEALIGTGIGFVFFTMLTMGVLKFWRKPPDDDEERLRWERDGFRTGVLYVPDGGEGYVGFSVTSTPLAFIAPYIGAGAELNKLAESHAKKQASLNDEALKRGVNAGEVTPLSPSDYISVIGEAAWQMLLGGSRSATALASSMSDHGTVNLPKLTARLVTPFVPLAPLSHQVQRMRGIEMDPKFAGFWDYLVPVANSPSRKVNIFGDSVANANDVSRILNTVTGGTFSQAKPGEPNPVAYQNLFASGYMPSGINPDRGYVIDGKMRPLGRAEMQRYVELRGALFSQELSQLDLRASEPAEARREAQSAFRRANNAALERIGVDVEASSSPAATAAPSAPATPKAVRESREPSVATVNESLGPMRMISMPSARSDTTPESRSEASSGTQRRRTHTVRLVGGRMRSSRRLRGRITKPRRTALRPVRMPKPSASRIRMVRNPSRRFRTLRYA